MPSPGTPPSWRPRLCCSRAVTSASLPVLPPRTSARRNLALALTVVAGVGVSIATAQFLDAHRPSLPATITDEAPRLAPEAVRRLSLGFGGLAADWYWLSALQYVGRKLEEQTEAGGRSDGAAVELDRIKAVDPKVLVRYFELITTLDPRFTAVYEFGAVVLPAVDVQAAVALRSEENTSELQSPVHLVCRLLLEKKKKHTIAMKLYSMHIKF